MTGWLRRSREPGAEPVRNPARPALGWIARGGLPRLPRPGWGSALALHPGIKRADHRGGQEFAAGRPESSGRAGLGSAGNAQHTAVARKRPQPFRRIRWKAKVDLAPHLVDGELLIHYGSPMITAANTVLVPTRRQRAGRGSASSRTPGLAASGAGRLTLITGRLRSPIRC